MTDVDLIGYLFDALDPEEQTQVEVYLRSHPDLAMRFDETRLALAPLEADRDQASAPEGLALRTLARVAAHLALHQPSAGKPEPVEAIARDLNAELPVGTGSLASPARPRAQLPPRDEPELTAIGGRFRFDILVAGCIALFACGLVFSSIGKLRERNQMVACQNTLRTVHVGLTGYADTHNGQYPRVGVGTNSTAETFVQALVASGQLPIGFQPCCPAAPPTAQSPVSYTYSLGYRAPDGGLVGLRRSDGFSAASDLVPISADFPSPATSPSAGPMCSHSSGMNVLFVDGHVQITTSALIGPGGDDIFRNFLGDVAAGKDRYDVVLGRPGSRP